MQSKSARLVATNRAQKVFALYLERLLSLIEGALKLFGQEEPTASVVLTRSALECFIDMHNLASEGETYLLVLQAMLLENRSAIFHFKTEPHYSHFVQELGESGAAKKGKEIAAQLKECLKAATERYPLLRYSTRNLTVLNRFRIAGMEERYHTEYTWLSMQAHNALEPILIEDRMRILGGETMDDAQDDLTATTVLHFVTGFLIDTVKCIDRLFGPDDMFTREFLRLLQEVDEVR